MPLGHALKDVYYRLAASSPLLRPLYAPQLPETAPPPPSGRPLRLEIVSHCWRYGTLLDYQLSSLVLDPPTEVEVIMTVFYSPEDEETSRVVAYFAEREVPGVRWNPRALSRERLFRRAIGRNLAALATEADWVWFTDCDVIVREGALNHLGRELLGRSEILVYPREHRISEMLPADDPLLTRPASFPAVLEVDTASFEVEERDRAVGGFQIVRGDVARAAGYCPNLPFYQAPAERWQKCREDRAFRWLLGTQGTPIEVEGIYRIRHAEKGRKGATPGAT